MIWKDPGFHIPDSIIMESRSYVSIYVDLPVEALEKRNLVMKTLKFVAHNSGNEFSHQILVVMVFIQSKIKIPNALHSPSDDANFTKQTVSNYKELSICTPIAIFIDF